jgi:hypothetical protein
VAEAPPCVYRAAARVPQGARNDARITKLHLTDT